MMKILGIGTDIVQQARIDALWERFGQRFVKRVLSASEQALFSQKARPTAFLAKRFAAKEAVAKAIGTGIGQNLALHEISVLNLPNGKPYVTFSGKSLEYINTLNIQEVMISLSDEKDHVLAFVVVTLS